MGTCWSRVAFSESFRFEQPSLFIDCRRSCASVCVCVGWEGCTVGEIQRGCVGVEGKMGRWGKCFSAAHVPLNHKTGAGGHLKVSPFKEPSPLAVARRNKGVKLEALSPPSPNNTPDRPVLALPPPSLSPALLSRSHCQPQPGRLLAF